MPWLPMDGSATPIEGEKMPAQNKNTDLNFLKEMKERLKLAREGDETQFDFLAQMIDDWIAELE